MVASFDHVWLIWHNERVGALAGDFGLHICTTLNLYGRWLRAIDRVINEKRIPEQRLAKGSRSGHAVVPFLAEDCAPQLVKE